MMKPELRRCLTKASMSILPALLLTSLALAGDVHEIMIDLETDDINIEKMDISHLEVGDSETIYTEDGKTIDILRAGQGVEIYIDGEVLDLSDLHNFADIDEEHEMSQRVIRIECNNEDEDSCANNGHWAHHDDSHIDTHEERKVIIIKKSDQGDDAL